MNKSVARIGTSILALMLTALVLSACGGGGSSTSSGSTSSGSGEPASSGSEGGGELSAAVAKAESPAQFVPPGPSFKVGSNLKGKRIMVIAAGLNSPYVQNLVNGIKEAAALVGASVSAGESEGDPAKASSLVQQAVGQSYGAIIIEGIPGELIAQPLKAASKAGLPIIEMNSSDPEVPNAKLKSIGISAIVSSCFSCTGHELAEVAVKEDGEDVDAVVFSPPEILSGKIEAEGFTTRLKELCASCESRVVASPLASWSAELTSGAQSALQRDPKVNYLVPVFDAMVQYVEPAVAQAGGNVSILTGSATQAGLEGVEHGGIKADAGAMQTWLGWAAIDQLARVESGVQIVADPHVRNRLFTAGNIGEVDLSGDEPSWFGSFDFKSEFSKVWEIG